MASTGSGNGGPIVGINVTPMVDVVLVLLVIMMVSATYIVSQSLKVELPKTGSSDGSVTSPASVTVTASGAYMVNGQAVSEAQLRSKLVQAKRENAEVNLVVIADQSARHGRVVRVLDIARGAGVHRFAINVSREP